VQATGLHASILKPFQGLLARLDRGALGFPHRDARWALRPCLRQKKQWPDRRLGRVEVSVFEFFQ